MTNVLIFLVFLGPLIFFHELGHFLFARLFGVKVEIFSIGFGPKLLKFVKGGTTYTISAIPLGGYVKMFGDDPYRETPLSDDDKKVAFNYKSKWARFWIVFGGPLANFILAGAVYFFLVTSGEKVPETRLGSIPENSVFYDIGFMPGDKVKKINDKKIVSFDDLDFVTETVKNVNIVRGDKEIVLEPNLEPMTFIEQFFKYATKELRLPLVIDQMGDYYWVGQENGQFLEEVSFEEILANNNSFELTKVKSLENFSKESLSTEKLIITSKAELLEKFKPLDLMVASLVMSSPADQVGIKANDVLIKIDNLNLNNFEELRDYLQKSSKESVDIELWRKGEIVKLSLKPQLNESKDGNFKTIGVYSGIKLLPPKMIESPGVGILEGIKEGFLRTIIGIEKTFIGYKKLITKEVGLKNIGGPLAIAKVASDHFNVSLSMFFRLMAMMSINLGIINLFPIPVLDGGHIVFLFLELLNGGPISRRKMEIAQKFGLSFLFFLIFVALFNDFTRYLL